MNVLDQLGGYHWLRLAADESRRTGRSRAGAASACRLAPMSKASTVRCGSPCDRRLQVLHIRQLSVRLNHQQQRRPTRAWWPIRWWHADCLQLVFTANSGLPLSRCNGPRRRLVLVVEHAAGPVVQWRMGSSVGRHGSPDRTQAGRPTPCSSGPTTGALLPRLRARRLICQIVGTASVGDDVTGATAEDHRSLPVGSSAAWTEPEWLDLADRTPC